MKLRQGCLTVKFKARLSNVARTQQLSAFTVLSEDLGSVPSTNTGCLTTICNSSFRGINVFFCFETESLIKSG